MQKLSQGEKMQILSTLGSIRKGSAATNLAEANTDLAGARVLGNRLNNFKNIADIITKPFRKVGAVLFDGKNPIAHYVALFIVIFLLIGGLSFIFAKKSKKNQGTVASLTSNPYNLVTRVFAKMLPGYRSRLMANSIQPYSGFVASTPRKKIVGRCDNVTLKESSTPKGGLCESTIFPNDIRWVIDPESIPELEKIPSLLKSTITGVNGAKNTVYIPWETYGGSGQDALYYYPNCSKATFSDGSSASHLFDDNGTSFCTKKIVPRSSHTSQYRPLNMEGNTNYKGLDTYASNNNPMC